ncbi:MAG: hypothetical protein ACR2O4_14840, partial [Hyphomicrobiaceae bacterium]
NTLEACADTCEPQDVAQSDFTEKNPAALVVQPKIPAALRTSCAACQKKVDVLNRLNRERAGSAARAATARNVIQSAERLIRQIAERDDNIRARVTKLVKERFLSEDEARKAALKKRLDALQAETLRLDVARTRQKDRIRQASGQSDEAKQRIRQLDREIASARSELSECESSCKVADSGTGPTTPAKPDGKTPETGKDDQPGKDVARLPGADTGKQTQPDSGPDVAEAVEIKAKCARCAVFARRINVLARERAARRTERDAAVRERQKVIQSIRANSAASPTKTKLVARQRELTQLIEKRNAAIDKLEGRLRRLRVSLERCEASCKAEADIASNDDDKLDPDTADAPDTGETAVQDDDVADAPSTQPKRTAQAPRTRKKIIIAEPALPRRKGQPEDIVARPRVFGWLIALLARDDTPDEAWETTVEATAGAGNVWVPETATINVQPAAPGTDDLKLDATTFSVTATTRNLDIDGPGTVAWGTLQVTRADGSENIAVPAGGGTATAARNVDYSKVRVLAGLGRETFDCMNNGGRCAAGLMAGIEHTSLDERIAGGVPSQGSNVDNTAAVFGVWGDLRLPLGNIESTGVALVLRGDAYVKGGHASGNITAATLGGTQRASASGGYVGLGANAAAELEFNFDRAAIAIGGQIGVDTLPTIDFNGGAADIENDTSTSSTLYIRGTLRF